MQSINVDTVLDTGVASSSLISQYFRKDFLKSVTTQSANSSTPVSRRLIYMTISVSVLLSTTFYQTHLLNAFLLTTTPPPLTVAEMAAHIQDGKINPLMHSPLAQIPNELLENTMKTFWRIPIFVVYPYVNVSQART
jgi:hypothetical protein